MPVGDVYDIERRVREVYPDLRIFGEPGCWLVKMVKPVLVQLKSGLAYATDRLEHVLTWKKPVLDARLLHHLRYTDQWSGHTDVLEELEEEEYLRRRAEERAADEVAAAFAKEARKALAMDFGWR
ncbi:MAG TPA: hypothetical protein VF226_04830 [Hyphomicrobiaceae bacterium]